MPVSVQERDTFVKEFLNVLNNSGASLAVGDVVELDVDSATGETLGYSVRKAQAASLLVVGVVVGDSIPDGERGQIQSRGICEEVTTDGTVTEGDILIAGAGVADVGTAGTNDSSQFGVALEDDDGTSLGAALLKCF